MFLLPLLYLSNITLVVLLVMLLSILKTIHLAAVKKKKKLLNKVYFKILRWCSSLFSYRISLTIRSQLQSEKEQRRASTVCSFKSPNEPCKLAPCLLAHFPHHIQILYKLAGFVYSYLLVLHFGFRCIFTLPLQGATQCAPIGCSSLEFDEKVS